MLTQEKMGKYRNPFFQYFLCSSILHVWRSLGHFWASIGARSYIIMLKNLDNKCRTLEDLSKIFDGL